MSQPLYKDLLVRVLTWTAFHYRPHDAAVNRVLLQITRHWREPRSTTNHTTLTWTAFHYRSHDADVNSVPLQTTRHWREPRSTTDHTTLTWTAFNCRSHDAAVGVNRVQLHWDHATLNEISFLKTHTVQQLIVCLCQSYCVIRLDRQRCFSATTAQSMYLCLIDSAWGARLQ